MSARKERRQKWWTERLKNNNTPPVSFGPNKQARGQQDSMERGKERVGKQTLLSSSSPAGFRSSQHTLGPLTDPLTPPLSNAEELDSSSSDSSTVRSRTELKKIPAHGASTSAASKETSMNKETTLSQQKRRYIAFIGNLPFTATGDDVIEQFEKKGLHISQVRLLTDRASGSSKGCCFAEFPNAKTLQNALKFHHTMLQGRRLNIEVTCGGGGRGESRMKKIRERNEKLRKKTKPKM